MKNIFFPFVLFFLIAISVKAQAPEESTADNPIWYYIQVVGEGERAGRVLTTISNDTKVYGRAITYSDAEKATQLWRFEKNGAQYTFINKATNKQLDIAYSSTLKVSHGILADASSATFSLLTQGNYFNIKSSKAATTGTSALVYAHQASDYGSRNFVLQFEESKYNTTPNSQFSFIKEEDMADEEGILPELSTADKPIWYHIQVMGEAERADRVFTVKEGEVYGEAVANSVNPSEVNPQLWRFEKEGSEYVIINKETGKKLDVIYADAPRKISILNVSDNPKGKWKFNRLSQYYYQLESTVVPNGGTSGYVYAHQSNYAEGVRNYVIMLEGKDWGFKVNSSFKFVKYDDPSVVISDNLKTVWYFISNTQENYKDKCITDITNQGGSNAKFSLENMTDENDYQYWKVVKNSDEAGDEKVQLINKATGNIIQTKSIKNGAFNYIQYTSDFSDSDGWVLNYIGNKQYEIFGKEKDNVTRYLYVGNEETNFPDVYIQGKFNSAFSWKFVLAEGDPTNIPNVIEDDILVYSEERKIIVKGTEDYTVWNIQGLRLAKDVQLPVGIYLVQLNNRVVKILVK